MRITGLVLAGGRGSRMDYVDKGLQPFLGEPMVRHVMKTVGAASTEPDDQYEPESCGLPVVWRTDLAGCDTGFRRSAGRTAKRPAALRYAVSGHSTMRLAIVAGRFCRMPERCIGSPACRPGVRRDGPGRGPAKAPGILPAEECTAAGPYIVSGERRAQDPDLVCRFTCSGSVFSDDAAFCNINTLQDLQKLKTT
jgi:hypothetical protein